jgi:hypothetical protein
LETTCSRFNINEEENLLISGTREKSAVRQFFSGPSTFLEAPTFPWTPTFS